MLIPYLLQNLSAASNTAISANDSATGFESISVQHDLSVLFPTGSGQRNFKLSKIALAVQEATQSHSYNLNASSIKLPVHDLILPKAHGSNDVAQAKEFANISVEAGWQDKAIAIDGVSLAISADTQDIAIGDSQLLVAVDTQANDVAVSVSHLSINKQLASNVLQAQALYVMGFFS